MTDLHALVHDAVSSWAPFAAAAALIGTATLAFALLVAGRAAHLLSARSRYMLLSIALIAPATGAMFVPTQLGGWANLFAAPGDVPAPVAGGTVDTSIRFTSVDAGGTSADVLCVLAALWAAAFLVALLVRSGERAMWRRIVSRSAPLDDARIDAIFRTAWGDRSAPPAVRASRDCDEPMVVGLARAVILLPHGYGEAMDDAEVEAVAVHELEHVRRRDNLDAALIDLFASIFWFDPFHWVARRHLLALREGACDERVLERGLPARAYLSALAKTSHAAIESPAVACMSGFRIRERMDSIMTYANRSSQWIPESLVRVAALAVLAIVAIAIAGFAPATAEPAQATGGHNLDVRIMPGPEGQALITAQITAPDGTLVSSGRIRAAAGLTATTITSVGGRDYKLSVTPAADGSGFAKLEVLEGDKVIDTVVKSIEAPAARMRKPAEPIDLHLTRADLKDVVKTFSELTGVEIKLAAGAEGKITLDVDDTPWDEALVRAVEPLGLKVVFGDGVILIGPASEPGLQSSVLAGALFKRVDPPPPPPPGYERVGGDVKAPQVITRVDPQFTEEARKERVQGIVIIEALVGEDGVVRDVKVLKGLPFGLDQAAADAVRQWTFLPAMKDGKPVAVVFNLTVNFKLDGGKKAEEKQ